MSVNLSREGSSQAGRRGPGLLGQDWLPKERASWTLCVWISSPSISVIQTRGVRGVLGRGMERWKGGPGRGQGEKSSIWKALELLLERISKTQANLLLLWVGKHPELTRC